MQINLRKRVTPFVLKIQKSFGFFPGEMCLITGAPRSGTSALCEWLGTHSSVSAFPESRILISAHRFLMEAFRFKNLENDGEEIVQLIRRLVFGYYSKSRILFGKKLVVDKEPLEPVAFPSKEYGRFVADFRKIIPNAKIIFAVRDPIATIWSMSQRAWGESLTIPDARKFSLEEYAENWCSCAELVSQYSGVENTYIVQFGRLVNDADNESKRILEFLNLHEGTAFQPRRTHEIGFSGEEREKILRIVSPFLEKLKLQGIVNLM